MTDPARDDCLIGQDITDIRPLPSDPMVRSIRVGRRAVARLRSADLESLGIAIGMEWTAELADRVAQLQAMERARRDALKLLSTRDRTSTDLLARLIAKDHDASLAQTVVDELIADGWIDDSRFAQTLAEELIERKNAGAGMVRQTLLQRGVDESLIESTVEETLGDVDPVAQAMQFAENKLRTLRRVEPVVAARRIASGLVRRGFDEDTIHAVLMQLDLPTGSE